jgi:hypothetical protein
LLRWNVNTLPRTSFVPPRVTRLTAAPELRPYSAEGLLATTWNSWTASVFGTIRTVPDHGPPLMLSPSTMALFAPVRWPLALKPMPCSCARKSVAPGRPRIPG